jgi:hypothetical protein
MIREEKILPIASQSNPVRMILTLSRSPGLGNAASAVDWHFLPKGEFT